MGIFSKKKTTGSDILDDISYIADFHHEEGLWNQYDFLLAARGYGWDYMIDTAEYMANAELTDIGTVSVTASLREKSSERIEEYKTFGSIKAMPSLSEEGASLGIGGMSNIIGGPVKIIWFNQTRVIRVFTPVNNEELLIRYVETMIRRTFGTPDAMKKAKPAVKK